MQDWSEEYARLIRERRCTYCRKPLAPEDGRECAPCKERRTAFEQERYQDRIANGQCARCVQFLPEGYAKKTCPACLEYVRGRERLRHYQTTGTERKTQPTKRRSVPGVHLSESPKWAALDAEMAIACEVCSLRGPHVCIERVDPMSRPGAGRTYPEGGI